jgi:phytoene dehydrogenase-like protein
MFDYAVVGSGIGGSSIAAYLHAKGHKVILFEKEPYLGGCSSSFYRKGQLYNTAATTLAGYQENLPLKEIFDAVGFVPDIVPIDPAIVVIQGKKTTPRYKDFEKFLEVLEQNYPHAKNRSFWSLVYEINNAFYEFRGHYYESATFLKKIRSMVSFFPLFAKFRRYLMQDGASFVEKFYGGVSQEYRDFLESQVLIVAQAPLKEINFFTAAISLGYTFRDNFYTLGGMGKIFDGLVANIPDVMRKSEITSITQGQGYFELHGKFSSVRARRVILNATVYDAAKLFDASATKNYYKKYQKRDNRQSSFMLYMKIKSAKTFAHHYQIIQERVFPHAISKALFVSFSDQNDTQMCEAGYYSITASIHTDADFWNDPLEYARKKQELQDILKETILSTLEIKEEEVAACFGATPKTFLRYIKREQLGGNAMSMKNFLPLLPGNDTEINGLYQVGDSVYPAQGWPGVMMGVKNLIRLLDA